MILLIDSQKNAEFDENPILIICVFTFFFSDLCEKKTHFFNFFHHPSFYALCL
tara:strand:- start:676 stop:834 length:159 start_codon:yes stop_codon:yes gene_type:complete